MSYELKSSIRNKKISPITKTLSIIVFIILVLHLIFPVFISNIFLTIISPVWSINKGDTPNIKSLSIENQNLIIEQLRKENISLKELLNRRISDKGTLAYILKKPPFTAYDSYIIDIGSNDKVMKGDRVYLMGNILIGEIDEVSNHTSKVKLYSSYGEKFNIYIGEKSIEAVAIGRGGGSFETVIPRDMKVKEGDIITIPDISNSVFGFVGKITTDPARAFSTILFSEPINIYEQQWVIVDIRNK